MKRQISVLLTATLLMSSALAAKTTSNTILKTKSFKAKKKFELTLETETGTLRDDNFEIKGTDTYFKADAGYRISKKVTLTIGAQYNVREMDQDAPGGLHEKRNSDYLDNIFIKALYKPTKFRDNGIADLRLQVRAYSDQNPYFKQRYGADGNYQLRAYFGRPLIGKISINKYTSYLRYKKYFSNSDRSNFSRDHELRARISPSYSISKGLDLDLTFTYNKRALAANTSAASRNYEEVADIGPSIRYQSGPYAILLRASTDWLQTSESGSLSRNKDAGKSINYALAFTAYL